MPHPSNEELLAQAEKDAEKLKKQIAERKAEKIASHKKRVAKKAATCRRNYSRRVTKKKQAKRRAEKRAWLKDNKKAIEAEAKRLEKEKAERKKEATRKQAETRAAKKISAAERELRARELSRRRLIAYIIRMVPGYKAGWVHREICEKLEQFLQDVIDEKSPRLMIQMPPRHGKSEIASKRFPAWVLGKHPELEIIQCSYASSLAEGFSMDVRDQLEDPEYRVIFPKAKVNPQKRNVTGWKTTKKGGFLPAGVGGPITGKGAHILIIDDPIKNAEEADSEVNREGNDKWYKTTAYTRLAPGGGVLVIQTRWHDDDLSGRLEKYAELGEGDEFEIIRYPAEATEDERFRKKGQALHRERYNEESLAKIKRAVGPRTWNALYQQTPTPDEGEYFQKNMFRFYNPDDPGYPPEDLIYYTAWDLAIGQKEQNDYTVGITVGMDKEGDLWVVDMRRGRWDAHEIAAEICDNYEKWNPTIVGIEKGQISMAIGPYLEEMIDERRLNGLYVQELPPGKRDKMVRARPIQGLMRRGRVWFPSPAHAVWVNELQFEMLRFPFGTHDDIVDALAWIGQLITDFSGPREPRPPKKKSWRDKLDALARNSGRRSPMSA